MNKAIRQGSQNDLILTLGDDRDKAVKNQTCSLQTAEGFLISGGELASRRWRPETYCLNP